MLCDYLKQEGETESVRLRIEAKGSRDIDDGWFGSTAGDRDEMLMMM